MSSMIATRDAYGETLAELGAENGNIVALDADLSGSTKTGVFAKKFPDRFFNMGIAEANMVCTAAGLAAAGKIPPVGPRGGVRWTARTFVRRLTWHILDHAWEIEDRLT